MTNILKEKSARLHRNSLGQHSTSHPKADKTCITGTFISFEKYNLEFNHQAIHFINLSSAFEGILTQAIAMHSNLLFLKQKIVNVDQVEHWKKRLKLVATLLFLTQKRSIGLQPLFTA